MTEDTRLWLRATPEPLELAACGAQYRCENLKFGSLEVFENRAADSGRKLPIFVLMAPATGERRAADPLFIILGGPGVSAACGSTIEIPRWRRVREKRDLVFVDLRGTGRSNPLARPLPGPEKDPRTHLAIFEESSIKGCLFELETTADLRPYTTINAMDDMDDVRTAWGHGETNIYGSSHGAYAAQVYLRRHGDHVRSTILHGVVPLDVAPAQEGPMTRNRGRSRSRYTRLSPAQRLPSSRRSQCSWASCHSSLALILESVRSRRVELVVTQNPDEPMPPRGSFFLIGS